MTDRLSFEPDPKYRWIYDSKHPEYNSDMAKWLRARRSRAIANAPDWMKRIAEYNDLMRRTQA